MKDQKKRIEMKEEEVSRAKAWLEENAHTPWALMRLELMEDYRPEELNRLAETGSLQEAVKAWNEELETRHMDLMRSGEYDHLSEIGDVMRAELIAEAQTPRWSVEELLDEALNRNVVLTEEQKDYLRENLPPWLAEEVDLLP